MPVSVHHTETAITNRKHKVTFPGLNYILRKEENDTHAYAG